MSGAARFQGDAGGVGGSSLCGNLMARAYAEHGLATVLIRPLVTRTLRVLPVVAETRNAGEYAGTFTFGELFPLHDFIIRQRGVSSSPGGSFPFVLPAPQYL